MASERADGRQKTREGGSYIYGPLSARDWGWGTWDTCLRMVEEISVINVDIIFDTPTFQYCPPVPRWGHNKNKIVVIGMETESN